MRTILLVEDDDVVRALVSEILETRGYTVLAAASPSEAVTVAAHTGLIDVLLTDLALPEMNGRELARLLRGTRPGLRVVLTSGRPLTEPPRGGDACALGVFIAKPYLPDELARILEEVLSRPDRESGQLRPSGARPAGTCRDEDP